MNKIVEVSRNKTMSSKNLASLSKKLKQIESRNSMLTPQAVVDEARNPKSILHKYFDWDDTTAAEKYRLQQARLLIHTVRVVVENKTENGSVRGFVSLKVNTDSGIERGYFNIARAMSDDELRVQLIEQARKEMISWRHRYASLTEFASVFDAIDNIQK